ncbi:unnamed protein product [Amoebophrya sp. A25]|nr:unnamed protein product [Amoebophrya sp. A25]|eukprot:GSA25T00008300001.1
MEDSSSTAIETDVASPARTPVVTASKTTRPPRFLRILRLSRFIQTLSALGISILYLVDIGCFLHPDGGLPAGEVREFYHHKLEKGVREQALMGKGDGGSRRLQYVRERPLMEDPVTGEIKLDDPAQKPAFMNFPILLENGQATKSAAVREYSLEEMKEIQMDHGEGEQEFHKKTICNLARTAVETRRTARYEARKRGSVLHRIGLFLRDGITYGSLDFTGMTFSFEALAKKQMKKLCSKQAEGAVEQEEACPLKVDHPEVCEAVYNGATRTNEFYNKALLSNGMSAKDGDANNKNIIKDQVFGTLEGYAAFLVETTAMYLAFALTAMLLGLSSDWLLRRI